VRSHPPDEEDAPPVSRDTAVHNQQLRCENNEVRQMVPWQQHSC
jgi:hypothetical protein